MNGVRERLLAFREAAIRSTPASASAASAVSVTCLALGWATVELERAVGELAEALSIPAGRFVRGADSEVLGARCSVADAVLPGGAALVVLEPATEGRLAATLAHVGEGPAAIWLAANSDAGDTRVAGGGGLVTRPARPGPCGVERLILGGPIQGPHRLLVGPPGTIRS